MNYEAAKKILESHGFKCYVKRGALRVEWRARYVASMRGPVDQGDLDRLITWAGQQP